MALCPFIDCIIIYHYSNSLTQQADMVNNEAASSRYKCYQRREQSAKAAGRTAKKRLPINGKRLKFGYL
jgi:hypothetical protein